MTLSERFLWVFFGLCNLIYTFLYHSDGEFDRKSGGEHVLSKIQYLTLNLLSTNAILSLHTLVHCKCNILRYFYY